MFCTVNRKALLQAITDSKRTLWKSKLLPKLACVRLEAREGSLHVTTTDLEVSTSIALEAHVEAPGVAVVEHKRLGAMLRKLKAELVNLQGSKGQLIVNHVFGHGSLPSLPADEYPTLPTGKEADPLETFEARQLGEALSRVSHAMSEAETRVYLNGLYLECDRLGVLLTATDGHRLAHEKIGGHTLRGMHYWDEPPAPETGSIPLKGITAPARWVLALEAAIGGRKPVADRVELRWDGQRIYAILPDRTLAGNAVEGEYPQWRNVIPDPTGAAVLTVDRDALLEAVEGMLPFALRNVACRLTYGTDWGLRLEVSDPDTGEARRDVPAEASGHVPSFALNLHYLRDAAQAAEGRKLRLWIRDANSPLRFEGEQPGYSILMSLRI